MRLEALDPHKVPIVQCAGAVSATRVEKTLKRRQLGESDHVGLAWSKFSGLKTCTSEKHKVIITLTDTDE